MLWFQYVIGNDLSVSCEQNECHAIYVLISVQDLNDVIVGKIVIVGSSHDE